MNYENTFWFFQGVLPHKFCDDVIEYGNLQQEQIAVTGGFDVNNLKEEDLLNIQKKRKSDIAWLSDKWIYRQVMPYVYDANKNAGWNLDLGEPEPFQFTKYKLNQFYGWHSDTFPKPYEDGTTRKLSVTCQLVDPSEFEGGELEFQPRSVEDPNVVIKPDKTLTKGSVVVFPSFMWHRVKPVTKGVRYSLVMWNRGSMFR
jgi:PKHD-type hydroxylase